MKIEIKNRFNGDVILYGEYESIKDCLEKNKTANLSEANLYGANLSWANLSGANLSRADLSEANLSGAKTDKNYLQTACIGSRKGMTTYCFDDDVIWCGCFTGTLKEFIDKVKEKYPDTNHIHRIEYDAFISMIRKIKKGSK